MTDTFTTLITNDDGIASPGLLRLAVAAVEAGLDVVVAAPASEASGASASITATEKDGRILIERRQLEGLDGVPAYAVQAAPALITLIAGHGAFGRLPTLVLSGVNRGANVGRAILHSGTVGAALTAGVNGGRGLAVSLDVGQDGSSPRWSRAARIAGHLIPAILQLPAGTVLNLNVPNTDDVGLPDIRIARLASFGIVQTTMTERDRHHVRLSVADPPDAAAPDTDAFLLNAGYATITAIQSVGEAFEVDLADLAALGELSGTQT